MARGRRRAARRARRAAREARLRRRARAGVRRLGRHREPRGARRRRRPDRPRRARGAARAMSERLRDLSLDELEAVPYHRRGGRAPHPARSSRLGFRVSASTPGSASAGDSSCPSTRRTADEELYVVVRGRATFTLGRRRVDAPAGTLVHVLAGENRTAVAEEPGTIVLAIGGDSRQGVHARRLDEDFVVAVALPAPGRASTRAARARCQHLLDLHGDVWAPYNAACFEALAGERRRGLRAPAPTRSATSRDTARQYAAGRRRPRIAARRPALQEVVG